MSRKKSELINKEALLMGYQDNVPFLTKGTIGAHEDGTDSEIVGWQRRCAVCLDPYHKRDTVRTIPCFHTFHAQCIDKWLGRKAECPVCKYPVFG